MTAPVLMAATRDASWYRNPGVSYRYHVATDDWMSACNPNQVMVVAESARPASEIPENLRCGRPGCRSRWP